MIDPTFCVLLDAGHGGIDPKTKKYTTAPAKQYQHPEGMHRDGYFFEGVFNRKVCSLIELLLKRLHIPVFSIYHDYADWSLQYRVTLANELHTEFPNAIGFSVHGNAFNANARGWEAYTSPGQTESDELAQLLYKSAFDLLSNFFPIRTDDRTDGDYDKEARFYILRKTTAPFVLSENGFFDSTDAHLMMHPTVQMSIAITHVQAILRYANDKLFINKLNLNKK